MGWMPFVADKKQFLLPANSKFKKACKPSKITKTLKKKPKKRRNMNKSIIR
jgi:hypothetical protein